MVRRNRDSKQLSRRWEKARTIERRKQRRIKATLTRR